MRPEDFFDYLALGKIAQNPWEIVRFRKAQAPGRTLEVRFKDGPPLFLRGGLSDFHMFHRIFLRDEYRLAGAKPGEWECVVDIGANAGIFSTRVSGVARRVLSYEPVPSHFEQLSRNTSRRANVTAVPKAVSGERGTLRIYRPLAESRSGAHSSYLENQGLSPDAFDEAEAVTLDDVFSEHGISRCDLLKLDVEGAEYEILHAASDETLSKVRAIHGEYHDVRADDPRTRIDAFRAFLEGKGFEAEAVPHRRKPNHGMIFARRRD
ncbi:FkbM family methyltransferase [bacterium]|nr:FkbM family methyltransferase [bacterium]